MIKVTDLQFGFGERTLLDKVSFTITSGEKVALVGANGSGKTTLFKLLTFRQSPDAGNIEINETIEYIPQEIKSDPIMDYAHTVRNYINQYQQFQDFEINSILAGLDMKVSLTQDPKTLSGGQKTRLAIARVLLYQPDIMLLDEPTNFLDISGKKWIMDFLSKYQKTLLIVSHDVDLLDHHIDKVLYINPHTHTIDVYTGNYSKFLNLKKQNEEFAKNQLKKQQRHLIEMKKGYSKISGRTSEKGVRQKLQLLRRIEKLEDSLPELPHEARQIKLTLPEPSWVGEMPILVKNVSKSFADHKVLDNINFDLKRAECISLAGPNGVGKSTLIKIIMGILKADDGMINIDPKSKIGYYSQEFETFDQELTLLDHMRQTTRLEDGRIRSILAKMLFSGNKIFQKISTLSGGEKTRLSIATLLAQNYNVLILDEPTTYLDPLSQRLILEALKSYKGAMIIVSHTPEFISELKPPRIFELPSGKFILTTSQIN